jgi:hypothetical protein
MTRITQALSTVVNVVFVVGVFGAMAFAIAPTIA